MISPFPLIVRYFGANPCSTSTPSVLFGKSRTWPTEALTIYRAGRNFLIVRALVGDSTMIRGFFTGLSIPPGSSPRQIYGTRAHARYTKSKPGVNFKIDSDLQLSRKLIMMRTKRFIALSTISSSSPGTKGGRMDSDMMQNGGTMGEESTGRRGGRRKGGRKKSSGNGRKTAGRKAAGRKGGRKKAAGGRKKSTGARKGGRKKSTGGRKGGRKKSTGGRKKGGRKKSTGGRKKGGRKKSTGGRKKGGRKGGRKKSAAAAGGRKKAGRKKGGRKKGGRKKKAA